MKKTMVLALVALMGVAWFTSAAPVALTLAYPSGDSKTEIMKEVVKTFEQDHKGVSVKIIVVPIANQAAYWGSYFDKLQTMIASGNVRIP